MSYSSMKIAIAQLNPTVGDLTGNAQRILEAAETAFAAGCSLLLTTELSLTGYPPRDLLIRPSFIQAATQKLQQLARDLPSAIAVLVGTVEQNLDYEKNGGNPIYNSAALLEQGEIKQYFQKRLLPTYDVFDEDRYFEPGLESDFFVLENSGERIKIGVTICEDLWNDESFWGKRNYACNPLAELVEKNIDLVVNLSASPYQVGKQKFRQSLISHSAKRYNIPILYANQVGGNDDLIFDGCSFAFNRNGDKILSLKDFDTDFEIIEFDSNIQDLTAISAQNQEINLIESEDQEIWLALVLGVKDYVQKCGFSQVILGLSGGIDSALVAAIATQALGKEKVLGVLMPSPYSSDHSIQDALELANNLGIKTQTLPIGDLMQTFDQTLEPMFAGTSFGVAEENLQSRIRGTLLMAVSNKFGHLLLTTGNKSEIAVGYCTLYGDMNGGLAVIADVPKTRVYSLCSWFNQYHSKEIIPNHILTKAPSAELKPGQVDQDSLPAYEILDDILYRLIEKHQSLAEIVEAGHQELVVKKVIKLVMIAEFKRRQAAPGLKISDRAFGTGWRMPIAKGIDW
ncbi:Glutamine-dependent NAD(+) synthetase [Planktothrix agardhii]|jgi:NAD+ synthase (glutamine-hydrolysing)|nr:Glutamine-dependent NAD(+) synthetase [Planktothrix agardhii]BBD55159.1 putative glutamine-dependent NAD(+) synthetase [Planktothrix agardhii NIES-204]CAD5926808.1 Glutamine-dependent NAD(+) synthetase [Planktothrix agardhii]CAD5928946.1 Glutamine-dependent NAD(+) synthetase [Planktothrix agardhii]CAD5932974.1 Glutamine-dependent NAD(+) synthetase [Planktothrix agardhii]